MKINHEITLDVARHGVQATIPLTQHEAGVHRLIFDLYNGSVPIEFGDRDRAVLYVDGDIYDSCIVYTENGVYPNCIVCDLSAIVTHDVGEKGAVLQIYKDSDSIAYSPEICFIIREDKTNGSKVLNSPQYSAVVKAQLAAEQYALLAEQYAQEADDAVLKVRINGTTNKWEISYDNGNTWIDTGVNAKGQSAYDLAVAEGFVGTKTEWLESLKVNVEIKQETGDSETAVMSQKATTKELNKIYKNYILDVLPQAIVKDNSYLSTEKIFIESSSWKSYILNVADKKIYAFNKLKLWTNNLSFYAIAFYSSEEVTADTFISGILFSSWSDTTAQVIENIPVPEGAVIAVICNRKATSEDVEAVASFHVNHVDEKAKLESTRVDLDRVLNKTTHNLLDSVYGNCYINTSGGFYDSGSWTSYIIHDVYEEIVFQCYTNDANLYNIGFYSSATPSQDTFISGIKPVYEPSQYYKFVITADDIPEGTKCIVFSSRTATGTGTTLTGTKTVTSNISKMEKKVNALELESKGRGNIKAIYKNIPNSNDFTIIKDEIWFAQNIYQNGVATEYTTIHRYKIVDGYLQHISDIDCDFGHWNTVDYNEDNDCLIFGNGANAETTEGNFFAIVKNPLALGSVARLETCGIKYPVDIGYKVQAVWGDSNWGNNNIVYLMSNAGQKIVKVLLLKDNNGEFNGEYVTLETKEHTTPLWNGGGDFWGDTLYVGDGSRYGLSLVSMSDYSINQIVKHYYHDDGTEYSGSTQGIHVDSNYIWVFSNVAGLAENYLVQYYR